MSREKERRRDEKERKGKERKRRNLIDYEHNIYTYIFNYLYIFTLNYSARSLNKRALCVKQDERKLF